jgi:hypothetical protein
MHWLPLFDYLLTFLKTEEYDQNALFVLHVHSSKTIPLYHLDGTCKKTIKSNGRIWGVAGNGNQVAVLVRYEGIFAVKFFFDLYDSVMTLSKRVFIFQIFTIFGDLPFLIEISGDGTRVAVFTFKCLSSCFLIIKFTNIFQVRYTCLRWVQSISNGNDAMYSLLVQSATDMPVLQFDLMKLESALWL